jgi:outer membrane protein TolC
LTYTHFPRQFTVFLLATALSAPAFSQTRVTPSPPSPLPNSPFLGGVPEGTATAQAITLSVGDAIRRALDHNLGVLLSGQAVDRARGTKRIELSDLLPNLSAGVAEARKVVNLEAFGFPLRGQFPPIVGPFNTFDARLFVRQSVFDLSAMGEARAEGHNVEAAQLTSRNAREIVILVTANLYLEALAASARADSARAQLDTAQALQNQASDLKQNGIIAGIDVVRADVRLSTERQRTTSAENEFEKAKLQLARVVGLPLGQPFNLSTEIPDLPMPTMTLEQALERAYRTRADYLAALERVRAAEASRQAIAADALPSVQVTADYGAIGLTAASARKTYTLTGAVNVPIFEGGRIQGRLLEADADLRARRAEADDARANVYYDVRTAFLDLQAIGEVLEVATRGRELANQQLTQARDRFAAGVADNLEVIQAQEAVALASEQYISAFYGFQVAKGVLAQSVGTAEEAVSRFFGGSK